MLVFLLFLLWLPLFSTADELLSARCQSKCLQLMEQRFTDTQQRRNLKHHILQMCNDDLQCSACSEPCRQPFKDVGTCKSTCEVSTDSEACVTSCEYLQTIFSEKPGVCPSMSNSSTYECTALCRLDGDCPETWKCCSSGCSRRCMAPLGRDPRLLPVPVTISIQERKRKRSVVVRWVLQKMTRQQTNSLSNLFVVQWRWGLHTKTMTEWQTVAVRNKPYAILKHLLSPGRFYEFRVGAVSTYGSLGFSQPSAPFKLSKEAKAPSAPKDIALGPTRLSPVRLWIQTVQWSPPTSDLPINTYQVSWASSTASEAEAYEEMLARSQSKSSDKKRSLQEDDEEWALESRDHHSLVLPSHSTQAEVPGLFPNSYYIIEIHAIVESTEGNLQGEKGVIFVQTANISDRITMESTTFSPGLQLNIASESPSSEAGSDDDRTEIDVQTPFYDGELQTGLNWLNTRICGPKSSKFSIKVRKGLCEHYQPHHQTDTKWTEDYSEDCAFVVRGLSFDCAYDVTVTDIRSGQSLQTSFNTLPCKATPAQTPLDCEQVPSGAVCVAQDDDVICRWAPDDALTTDTVIGYKVVLTTQETRNITINPPHRREVLYEHLRHGQVYNVVIHAITNKGVRQLISTSFTAPSMVNPEDAVFPGGQIIELPLESTSSWSLPSVVVVVFMLICRLLNNLDDF